MVFGLTGRNPEKLEAKALDYERRGKTAKALKCREKAQKLRTGGTATSASTTTGFQTLRTPQRYEQNALKWEQRGNWTKAQKNREKVWRLQNPQFGPEYTAPAFYSNNKFLRYSVAHTGAAATIHHTAAPIVETHVRPTVVEQTVRPEKIVEVQPVVHREIDAPQVHVVEKHIYEKVTSTGPNIITNKPIVEETVKPRIIEEIQPVVHREVPAPFVERVEQHVSEKVTQPIVVTKEVVNDATVHPVPAGGPVPVATGTTHQGPLAGVKNAINTITHKNQ